MIDLADLVNHADPQGVLGSKSFAGEEVATRLSGADARHRMGRDDGGQDAQLDLAEGKNAVVGGDRDVTGTDQAGTAAECGTVSSHDHRAASAGDGRQHSRHAQCLVAIFVGRQLDRRSHPVHIGTGTEDLSLAGEYDHSHRWIGIERVEAVAQCRNQSPIEGIAYIGSGEHHIGSRAVSGHLQVV